LQLKVLHSARRRSAFGPFGIPTLTRVQALFGIGASDSANRQTLCALQFFVLYYIVR